MQPQRLRPFLIPTLIIMPGGGIFKTVPINRDICSDHKFPAAYLDGNITMEWFFLCLHKLDYCGSSDKNARSN